MSRVRVAPLAAMILVGGLVAVAAANCASPTQIIVDVRADSTLCTKINTGIAVTAPGNIDNATLSTYQDGCRSGPGEGQSQVGSLTITPSGADDAEVGIKIVAAIGASANPDACGRKDADGTADWSSCILARRTARFAPGETVTITVRLTSDCVGQYCGDDRECSAGVCVRPEQVQDDGGILDAEVIDFDTGSDANVDAGDPDCARFCKGPGATCVGNTCAIDCSRADDACNNQNVTCGGEYDCVFKCGPGRAPGAVSRTCIGVTCTTTKTCTFDCTGPGGDHCKNIACSGSKCDIACSNTDSTCRDVTMDAGASSISCGTTTSDNPTCKDISCFGNCTRLCLDGGLGCAQGDTSSCEGNCAAFEDAGVDSGKGKN